jgi:hypothetical protein
MGIIRVLVALAEQADDRLRGLATELICEHAVLYPESISYAGGLRMAFLALFEGVTDYQSQVVHTFMYLIDGLETRKFVRPMVELEMVISQFTDAYTAKGAYNMDRLRCSTKVIQDILGTWTGLYYFCVGNKQSILAIVEALSLPSTEVRIILLESLRNLFSLVPENAAPWKIQFSAIRLMLFVDAGVVEAIVEIAKEGELSTCNVIFPLLSDILTMCALYLPREYNDRVQGLPQLFATASDFRNELSRHVTQDRLVQLFQSHTEKLEYPKATSHLQKQALKVRLTMAIDDQQLRNMLNDSEVLGLKDYTRWNWDVISELVHLATMSPTRFDELNRLHKFIPRLLLFLKPSSKQFCEITLQHPEATKIVRICSDLLVFLASTDGNRRILSESRVVQEISEKLQRLVDPSNMDIDNVFSKEKMETSMAREYFTLLGRLQDNADTRALLKECGIWTTYYALIELRGRDDIVKRILNTGLYNRDGHMRVIFSKLLVAGYKEMRLFTTLHVNELLDLQSDSIFEWIAGLLGPQLFDPAQSVIDAALQVIQKGCKNTIFLQSFVRSNPDVEQISKHDTQILFRFLEIDSGCQLLLKDGFLQSEMRYWIDAGLLEYADTAERYLSQDSSNTSLPLHLFGMLTRTTDGCQYLKENGQLEILLTYLYFGLNDLELDDNIRKQRAAIWAVAHISQTNLGLGILESYPEMKATEKLLSIALESPILSTRGIAWHALSLTTSTIRGQELLGSYNVFTSKNFCLPLTTRDSIHVYCFNVDGYVVIQGLMA